jgi:penicillin-binding protein 2
MKAAGLKRGVIIVMNPQTGEILAMVSLPTYDDNLFARGISAKDYGALLSNPDKPLLNHAIAAHYPPGSTYKLVTGTGVLADHKITASTRVQTRPYLTLGSTRFYDWNHRGFGACTIYCGFGHSSDTFFFQMAGKLGIDRLAHWANQYGFGQQIGIDLPGEVSGFVPTNEWKLRAKGEKIFPARSTRPASAGLRRRHADPADQRLRGPRQRRQALSAAARPRRDRARRQRGSPVPAEAHPASSTSRQAC